MPTDETNGLDNPEDGGVDTPISNDETTPDGRDLELDKLRAASKLASAEAKKARQEKQALEAKFAKLEQDAAEEDGRWQELYKSEQSKNSELSSSVEELDGLREAMVAMNDDAISQLPEEMRVLVKDHWSPMETADFLATAVPLLRRGPVPDVNAGAGGSGGVPPKPDVEITQADKDAAYIAAQHGRQVDAESIARRRAAKTKLKQ